MSDVFGGPVVVNGVSLPRLTMRDIDSLRGSVIEAVRRHVESLIPAKASAYEQFDMRRVAIPPYVGLELLQSYIRSLEGARLVLELSAKAANVDPEKLKEIESTLSIPELVRLGLRLALGDNAADYTLGISSGEV